LKKDANGNTQAGVKRVDLFAKTAKNDVEIAENADKSGATDKLNSPRHNFRVGTLVKIPRPKPTGKFTLFFNDTSMEDLWLALAWGKGA
jgi:hypothetical protein